MIEKILFSWSGGKDSALALYELIRSGLVQIDGLLTTVSEAYDRICIHGVRKSLLEAQVAAMGLKLHEIRLPEAPTNAVYEKKLEEALLQYRAQGINRVGFGDIFLEDLKRYRDDYLARINMQGIYPIWKRSTAELIRSFSRSGFKAVITCVDLTVLPASFAGREINESLLHDLPPNVDPCGENGEFHSFVYEGPIFRQKIKFELGGTHQTERFMFRDLVPVSSAL